MAAEPPVKQTDFRAAFAQHERQVRINTGKLACALVFVLMPLGAVVDYFVYPKCQLAFLGLRLSCSLLIVGIWMLHHTALARRFYPVVGMPIVILPAFCMCCMMEWARRHGYPEAGAASSYYAALNLILLAVSAVGHWSIGESLFAVGATLCLYVGTYLFHPVELPIVFTHVYFIALTGIIVVCGNYLFNRLRYREFTLRHELDQSRRQLEANNQKLMELDQLKNRFFANISHELRTPLTLLLAPLETLMQRFGRSLDIEAKEMLGTMQSNGMRLLKLINDLLDLVRLESGRMEIKREPLDVAEFAAAITSAARQVAKDKRLKLVTFIDPGLGTVLGDRDKLDKIVLNLVFNALKFTPAGGQVELRAERRNEHFSLLVRDTGMGISPKNLPHVFDRFWQADGSSKRKYQGMGIGLALVKELVEVQGGQVSVESQEGKGTVFTVLLPYAKAEQVAASAPSTKTPDSEFITATPSEPHGKLIRSEEWLSNLYRRAELFPALTPLQDSVLPSEVSSNGHKPVILVADDEPDMLRFVKTQLSREYQVLEAVDGQQAVEKAAQFLPDLVLLDMMMPEKDGLQACREIREATPTRNIPVILLTARADEDTKLAALSAGASDFLAKPFSTTELQVRIKNLVESHRYESTLSKQKQVLESTIEQLKETETQLVQSEKLASLGRMSAGIIHEINNPLNFASTGLYTLRKKGQFLAPEQQPEYEEVLRDVEDGIKRVKNIVSDLRMFTHPETESRDHVELASAVGPALRFLSNELKDKVRVENQVQARHTVYANSNKLVHLLVNLLQNSFDALQEKTFVSEQPAIWLESRSEHGKTVLVVRDNGIGIEPENVDKIFDPFFTTKDVGQGMGLGLAICYRIVHECEGRISVRTERGKFCEFTLEFPAKG